MQKNFEITLCISTWPQGACDYPHRNAQHYPPGYPPMNDAVKGIERSRT